MSVLLVKQRIRVSEPPFWGRLIRSNVCDSSLARWKARSRLSIGYNWTFSLALTAEALIRRNRLLLKGWVTLGVNTRLKGYVYHQHLYCESEKDQRYFPFVTSPNVCRFSKFFTFGFSKKFVCAWSGGRVSDSYRRSRGFDTLPPWSTTTKQVANLLCAQDNSAFYPLRDGKLDTSQWAVMLCGWGV